MDPQKIVVVGGGSAGWLTAGLLAAEHARDAVTITLIESPDVPTVGVGEGTWPSMRTTLATIGIDEATFVTKCNASFKQGTHFFDWSDQDTEYIHPFSLPVEYTALNPARFWLASGSPLSFTDFVTPQGRAIERGLAPKEPSAPDYAFNLNYGYHFDAGRFAELLTRHVTSSLGVHHHRANVTTVEAAENGDIESLALDDGTTQSADLFVDCTGSRALLLAGHFGVPLVSVRGELFNDRARVVQVPYTSADQTIASATRATAVTNGWIWDIGLTNRRGIGYVHSSAHADEAEVENELRSYVDGTAAAGVFADLEARTLAFEPGYRSSFWQGNCVAVGLSAGFVEPLEASSLAMVEQAATMLARELPQNRQLMDIVARRFNAKMTGYWQTIIEFLKLHYALTRRTDSQYWLEHQQYETWPEALEEKLTLWHQQTPWFDDAPRVDELFPSASYQYVLYGMGFRPTHPVHERSSVRRALRQADSALHRMNQHAEQLLASLPDNRTLVSALAARSP